MYSIGIIVIFLVIKSFQWLNSFIFAALLGGENGFTIMIGILIFVVAIFVFSLLAKKFLSPSTFKFTWVVIVFALIISILMDPLWTIIFLAGLFLYALIAAEAQVLRSFAISKNIPRFVPFLLTLFPIVISYKISHKFITYEKVPPFWLGLFFIAGSGLLYYFGIYSNQEALPIMIPAFVLLFYASGALAIYVSIDVYLRQARK